MKILRVIFSLALLSSFPMAASIAADYSKVGEGFFNLDFSIHKVQTYEQELATWAYEDEDEEDC